MSGIIGVSPDMRSGVIGKYPAGHVLQKVGIRVTGGSYSTVNSSSFDAYSGLDTQITLRSDNSVIYYTLFASMTNYISGTENYYQLSNFIDTGSGFGSENVLTDGYDFMHDRVPGYWRSVAASYKWEISNGKNDIYKYRVSAKTTGTGNTAWLKYSDGSVIISLTEVQG